MKIKVNNIFKNLYINKCKIKDNTKIEKRRNIKHNKTYDNNTCIYNDAKIQSKEYKRNGASNNINILDKLKIFTKKFTLKKSYYILFILMAILASVSIYTNLATYRGLNKESYAVFSNDDKVDESTQVQSSVLEELQDSNSNNIDTRNNIDNKTTTENVVKNTTVKNTPVIPIVEPLKFVKPLNGEIIKVYSVDKLLFSKTLESWKTHDGVDIKGNLGENVISIEKGIVEKIYEDSFLGMTIVIDHGQGYKSIYSNMDNSVNVKEKQVIKKSVVIGKVGKTSIGEIKDDSHIHFMLMFNNQVIDPTSKIKF